MRPDNELAREIGAAVENLNELLKEAWTAELKAEVKAHTFRRDALDGLTHVTAQVFRELDTQEPQPPATEGRGRDAIARAIGSVS